jgi:hypothetical protein
MDKQTEEKIISHLPREVTKLVIRGNMPLVKAWRIHLGIPLGVAAEKSGLHADVIAWMERNDNILSEELKKVAQALGVNVDLLVDLDPLKDQPDVYC